MKKSPFSTPRGNGARQGLWNSSGSPGRGYVRPKSYEFNSPNRSHSSLSQSGGEDFIPFDNTPPPSQRKSSDWQSPRGHWQGSGGPRSARRHSTIPGYTNFRENRGRDNHQQHPYFKDGGRQFQGTRKNFQRGNKRGKADISQYMNLRWFLEDPWADLSRKSCNVSLDESRNEYSSDLSFGNAVLGNVCLDDSMEGGISKRSSLDAANDSLLESDNSFVQTSQEFADISACSDSSQYPKLSQDYND